MKGIKLNPNYCWIHNIAQNNEGINPEYKTKLHLKFEDDCNTFKNYKVKNKKTISVSPLKFQVNIAGQIAKHCISKNTISRK